MYKEGAPVYQPVSLDRDYLAGKAVDRYSTVHARTWQNFSPHRWAEIREEFRDSVGSLQESLATGSPAFLIDYSYRARARQAARHFPEGFTASYLRVLAGVLAEELPPDYRENSARFIRKALAALKAAPEEPAGTGSGEPSMSPAARAFLDALRAGDQHRADTIVENELESGTTVHGIYSTIFQPVLVETGRLWQENAIGIDREHYVSAAILRLMGRLDNRIVPPAQEKRQKKTVVAACVGEELHEIGIRMVADYFRMDGWDVHYIGANIPASSVIDAVKEQKAGVLALSVTLLSRLSELRYLIRSLRADPVTAKTKVIVGGYPFLLVPDLWKQVGADAGVQHAEEVVAAARRLVAGTRSAGASGA
jgi:MerR family transcriptional regulator, light-induced transcriptional regulator